ncbi:hypothetical protein WJX77_011499 [Trebouxia sp. C0004]
MSVNRGISLRNCCGTQNASTPVFWRYNRFMETLSLTRPLFSLSPTTTALCSSRGASMSITSNSGPLSPSGGTGSNPLLALAGSHSSA